MIASDKTGTLTRNELRLRATAPAAAHTEAQVLRAAVLASTAELVEEDGSAGVAGDPVEGAILLGADERGLALAALRAERTVVRELPFDPDRKRMTLVYRENGGARAYTKGAPEVVLARSSAPEQVRRSVAALAEDWAGEGLRVLAVAERPLDALPVEDDDQLERGLELLGLVALHDPLRDTAEEAIAGARRAGLVVHILTGDHPATAGAIASELGLPEDAVFARITPRDSSGWWRRSSAMGRSWP